MLWNAESPWTPGLCFFKIKFVGSHTKSTESVRIFRQHVPRAGANFKRPAATGLMALELENILNLNLTLFSELSFQFGLLLRPLECVHHISKSVKRIYTDVLCMRLYYSNAQSSWRGFFYILQKGCRVAQRPSLNLMQIIGYRFRV